MSSDFLDRVRLGFSGPNVNGPVVEIILSLLVLILLIFIVRSLWKELGRNRNRASFQNPDEIADDNKIIDILDSSVHYRAGYCLAAPGHEAPGAFDFVPRDISGNELVLTCPEAVSTEMLPEGEVRNVGLRFTRAGKVEFYHFQTTILESSRALFDGKYETTVKLALPDILYSGENRCDLRVSPALDYGIDVAFLTLPEQKTDKVSLDSLPRTAQAKVINISLGGLKAWATIEGEAAELVPGRRVLLFFRLPAGELELGELNLQHIIRAVVLEREDTEKGPVMLRVKFEARGSLEQGGGTVVFQPVKGAALQDLARWIMAYQRYEIRLTRRVRAR